MEDAYKLNPIRQQSLARTLRWTAHCAAHVVIGRSRLCTVLAGGGMGSPQARRKRKRTMRTNLGLKKKDFPLPFLSVLCSVALILAVSVRNYFHSQNLRQQAERKKHGRNGAGGSKNMPLAVLLQEQHEIGLQAARYADPAGECLALSAHSSSRDAFTCVADVFLFIRALATVLDFPTLLVVDVGNGSLASAAGSSLLGNPEEELKLRVQGHVTAEEENPSAGDGASVVLVNVYQDRPTEIWSYLIRKWLQATAPGGMVVIHSQRGFGWGRSTEKLEDVRDGWDGFRKGSTGLREAVTALMCGDDTRVSAFVGDFDGGVVVVHRARQGEGIARMGCSDNSPATAAGGRVDFTGPRPLQFEELLLSATGDNTGTIESVQDQFGGVDVVRNNACRRSSRMACFNTTAHQAAKGKTTAEKSSVGRNSRGRLRKGRSFHGEMSNRTAAEDTDMRDCLREHVRSYPDDVRAAFVLEMIALAGLAGRDKVGVDRSVSRLRDNVLAESGQAGALLWRRLYNSAAAGAATGATS